MGIAIISTAITLIGGFMQYTNSRDMVDKEMRKEIYKLRRELKAEAKQIKELAQTDKLIPLTGTDQLKQFEKELRKGKSVKNQDTKELRKTLRQLRYINDLETSHLSGAVKGGKRFEPIRQTVEQLNEEQKKEFWQTYKELYREGPIYERFRYELYEIMDREWNKFDGLSPDQLVTAIKDLRDRIIDEFGGGLNNEDVDAIFGQELKELLR